MSSGEVDAFVAAIRHADDLHNEAPYNGMNPDQIDRRYAQWIIEHLRDQGFWMARTVE